MRMGKYFQKRKLRTRNGWWRYVYIFLFFFQKNFFFSYLLFISEYLHTTVILNLRDDFTLEPYLNLLISNSHLKKLVVLLLLLNFFTEHNDVQLLFGDMKLKSFFQHFPFSIFFFCISSWESQRSMKIYIFSQLFFFLPFLLKICLFSLKFSFPLFFFFPRMSWVHGKYGNIGIVSNLTEIFVITRTTRMITTKHLWTLL